jgi:murein L,D-transpeptidase YcbB/YkuD
MYSVDEMAVALKEKVPVHIVYFTAWPRRVVGSTHGRTCTVTMRSSGRTEPFL